MGGAAVEENQHGTDAPSPFKATTSCIPVDSISVDISSSCDKIETSERCNHFSIRGYVAEVRQRDKKLCFPFCTDDGENESLINSYELPPIEVPKFRSWECDGCLQASETPKSGEADDLQLSLSSDPTARIAATSSRRSDKDWLLPFKARRRAPFFIAQERKSSEPGASDPNANQNCTTISADPRGKALAYGTQLKFGQEKSQPASADGLQLDILLQDHPDDDSVVVARQDKGIIEFELEASETAGVSEAAGLARDKSNSGDNPGSCQFGEQASARGRNKDLQATRVEAAATKQAGKTTIGRLVPLPDLNKIDDGTLDNDKDFGGNNPCDEDDEDDLGGGSHRKTRKTRLLSELLGPTEYRNVEHVRREGPSPVRSSDRSTVKEMPPNDRNEALVNQNGFPHVVSTQKRKMTSNDGGHRPLEIKGSCEGAKKLRIHNLEKENTKPIIIDSDTESDERASVEIVRPPVAKRSYSLVRKHKPEEKSKKAKVDKKGPSMVARPKAADKVTMGKTLSADKHSSAAECSRRMNQRTEKRSSMVKGKKVCHQNGKQPPCFVPWKKFAPKDCSTINHGEAPPTKDASSGKELNKSLIRSSIQNDAPQFFSDQDESSLQLALQGLRIKDDDPVVRKDSEHVIAGASTNAPNIGGHTDTNGGKGSNQRSNAKGKEKMFPEVQPDILPRLENVVSPSSHKLGTSGEVRGIRQDIDINAIPPDDKVSEQATSEDIPMDIVELMAKHQHERQESLQTDKHFTSGPSFSANTARPNDNNRTNISYVHRPVPKPNMSRNDSFMQRLQSDSARNGASTGFYDPGSIKQKPTAQFPDVNRTYVDASHTKEAYSFGRLNDSAIRHENVPRETRLPSLALACNARSGQTLSQRSSHGSTQGLGPLVRNDGTGRPLAQMFLHGSTQGLGPLNRCLTTPQQYPGNQLWATAMQKCGSQGQQNSGTVPGFNQRYGQLNLDTVGPGKQQPTLDPPVRPGGAMYLLNMVQSAGNKQSSLSCAKEGNPEFLRSPAERTVQPYSQYSAIASGYTPGSNSRRPSLDIDHRRNSFRPILPRPSYPRLPNVSPFASPFRYEPPVRRPLSGVTNHSAFTALGQMRATNSLVSGQGRNLHWQPMQTIPSPKAGRNHVSAVDKGNGTNQPSSSANPLPQSWKDLISQKRPETQLALAAPQTDVCAVNINPAELDENSVSKYMIEGEKLKPVRWSGGYRSRAKAMTKRARRRQRRIAGREQERPRKS